MTLTQYAKSYRTSRKIPAAIAKRWRTRVVARGLHQLGAAGATQYLADYGRGIGAQKCVDLARMAEREGYPEMAQGFWRQAYALELGHDPPADDAAAGACGAVAASDDGPPPPAPAATDPQWPEFPDHLQPGAVHTMQAVDADRDREYYIASPEWWGQPKRDGQRCVILADSHQACYQARSMKLNGPPSPEIDAALRAVAAEIGPFILDAEVYYADVRGAEHRTGAQAATVNGRAGQGHVQPGPVVAIFKALFFKGYDLTRGAEKPRIAAGEQVGAHLVAHAPASFEVLPTARTALDKRALVERQQAEGREGEVWVRYNCRYVGGKDNQYKSMVRTKYVTTLDVVILDLTPTTAAGRPFGAIEVGQYDAAGQIVSLGKVGTGFNAAEMAEIARRHVATPDQVVITIASQGFTEQGQVWHGRFIELRHDKPAADCTLVNPGSPAKRQPEPSAGSALIVGRAPDEAAHVPPATGGHSSLPTAHRQTARAPSESLADPTPAQSTVQLALF